MKIAKNVNGHHKKSIFKKYITSCNKDTNQLSYTQLAADSDIKINSLVIIIKFFWLTKQL